MEDQSDETESGEEHDIVNPDDQTMSSCDDPFGDDAEKADDDYYF